ncbi:hypothetical protein ACNKHN_21145 [Shigella flexneri]
MAPNHHFAVFQQRLNAALFLNPAQKWPDISRIAFQKGTDNVIEKAREITCKALRVNPKILNLQG